MPVIRAVSAAEFASAVDWAAAEGWNPGLDDLAVFHAADPQGFLMGFIDGEPVSSISVVRYGDDFGFLGFYIVDPKHRGTGVGIATWNAGIEHLKGRTIGLDGVVAQQDNYRKSGFALSGRNIRHTGVPNRSAVAQKDCEIRPVEADDLDMLADYDRAHFSADRSGFLQQWVLPGGSVRRKSLLALSGGSVAGYGTIRACRTGYKIGPLFADHADIAETLFASLAGSVAANSEVSLDTPEGNVAAVAMAHRAGLVPAFETARMYRGKDPNLPLEQIFGITTFELG
jgi:GNAT superfamily N-acetyltransferase